jgi:hypothetical protein
MKIVINRIQCLLCQDIIESNAPHDFRRCSCKSCGVDGGSEYLKRIGSSKSYKDLSLIFEDDNENENQR